MNLDYRLAGRQEGYVVFEQRVMSAGIKARLPLHRTSNPMSRELSSVLREAASGSEERK